MIKKFKAGNGTTAVLNTMTGKVKLKSNGGTLWPDWLERENIDRNSIYTIYTEGTIYAPENMQGIDTKKNIFQMFGGLKSLRFFDMTGIDTSRVTNMQNMFWGCCKLKDLDLSGFDTARVTNMSGMFAHCDNLTNLNLDSFDTSNVIDMRCMFYNCYSLASLNLSGFDTSKVTDLEYIFAGCGRLKTVLMRNTTTEQAATEGMFNMCPAEIIQKL